MAEIEKVSEGDRMEREGLERTVADIERQLSAFPIGTRPFFSAVLLNAKARLGVLDKKIQDEERDQRALTANEVALVELANKETALNAKEKEAYSGFLKEDFFTKKDFGRLEEFYGKSWDKLSDEGKKQMSHRIWEGVRHGEYTFDQLPPKVREKELKQAYKVLHDTGRETDRSAGIPETDRNDFIRAYEAGKRDEAERILERKSFKDNMFRGAEAKAVKHAEVQTGRDAEGKAVGGQIAVGSAPGNSAQPGPNTGKAKQSVLDVNMDGLTLADATSPPSSANIPRGAPAPAKSVPSLGSG